VTVAAVNAPGCEVDYLDCDPGVNPTLWEALGKPGSWCCAYQHLGDSTGDGWTNILDLLQKFKPSYGKGDPDPLYNPDADCNHDGWVNILDLLQCFKPNYGQNHTGGAPYDCEHD
jgi:hypothetical protein